ncbi:MAG TPA: ATP-binding protein [Thermoanaerobaculia bacterium]|nr:ATP-binding protein [Thermoanaerobaculia bacterium]
MLPLASAAAARFNGAPFFMSPDRSYRFTQTITIGSIAAAIVVALVVALIGFELPGAVSTAIALVALALAGGALLLQWKLFRQVTKPDAAEQKLRRSEAQRRALFEASPDSLLIIGRDMVYREVIQSRGSDPRYSREGLIGRHAAEALPAAVVAEATELVEKAFTTRQVQVLEYRLPVFDELRDHEARIVAIDDDEVVVFVRDLTAKREAIRELALSEERFRLVTRATNDAVWDWDIATNRVWRSPMFHALFGKTEFDDDTYEGWQHRVHAEDLERIVASIFAVLQSDHSSWEVQYRFIRADGTYASVRERCYVVRDAEGKPIRVLGAMADVSAEQVAEQQRSEIADLISRSAEEWRATFDSVGTPILLLDTDGRVVRLNRTAAEWVGEDFRQAFEAPVEEFGGGRLSEAVRALQESAAPAVTREITDPEGRIWSVRVTRREHGATDRVAAIVVAWEITQLLALQQSLRRSETLAAMGSLVAGVAHEVRNPLFGISATVDAFEPELGEKGLDEFVAALREQVDRLTQLMTDLLEYGKPPRFIFSRTDLRNIVPQAIRGVSLHAAERKVSIDTSFAAGVPEVMLDKGRILQVLENLLENAINHTPPGGMIQVEVNAVRDNGSSAVTCSVRDSGSGFDPADIPRLFHPFFTKRRGGTGLGLAIAHKIIEAHGGRLDAANGEGGGGVVTFSLNAESAAVE